MAYTALINNKKYPIKDGVVKKGELSKDKLPSETVVLNTNEKLDIQPFDLIVVQGDNIRPIFMKVDNFIETVIRYEPTKSYEYTINLFSEKKDFERYTMPSLSITVSKDPNVPRKTITEYLLDFVDRYTPKRKFLVGDNWVYSGKYSFDQRMLDRFSKIPCPEFSWNDPTLSEVLDDLLMVDDCIFTVNNDVISYIDLSSRDGQEIDEKKLSETKISMASGDYISGITITMKNSIGKNLVSNSEYQSARSEGGEITTDNMVVFTQQPIYDIKSIKACFVCPYAMLNGAPTKYAYVEADITRLVKEEEEFNTLLPDDLPNATTIEQAEKYQKYCLYYKRGDNKIQNLGTKKFYSTTIRNTLLIATWADPDIKNRFGGTSKDPLPSIADGYMVDFRDIGFKIEYETLGDRKMHVGKYLPIKNENNSIFDNQTSSYVNVQSQSILEYAKANRLGNEIMEISAVYKNDDDIPNLGDYIGDYILFSTEISYLDGLINFKGMLTKNYVMENYFTGVNSKHRSWQIVSGKDALTRYEVTKLFGEFSFYPKADKIDFISADNRITGDLIACITGKKDVEPITTVVAFTEDADGNRYPSIHDGGGLGYELDLGAEAQGMSLCFTFGFVDNYGVGNFSFMDKKLYRNGIYKYVDSNGEFENLNFLLMSGTNLTGDKFRYPDNLQEITKAELDTMNENLSSLNKRKPLVQGDNIPYIKFPVKLNRYNKDNREIVKHTMQFEFCSDNKNIIVTKKVAELSRLLGSPEFKPKIYIGTEKGIYNLNSKEPIGLPNSSLEIKATTVYGALNSIRVELVPKLGSAGIPFHSSWGVADQNGNLLLGVNNLTRRPDPTDPMRDTVVYFNLLIDRDDNIYDIDYEEGFAKQIPVAKMTDFVPKLPN